MLVLFYETILKLSDLHNLERRYFAEILKAMLRLYKKPINGFATNLILTD